MGTPCDISGIMKNDGLEESPETKVKGLEFNSVTLLLRAVGCALPEHQFPPFGKRQDRSCFPTRAQKGINGWVVCPAPLPPANNVSFIVRKLE